MNRFIRELDSKREEGTWCTTDVLIQRITDNPLTIKAKREPHLYLYILFAFSVLFLIGLSLTKLNVPQSLGWEENKLRIISIDLNNQRSCFHRRSGIGFNELAKEDNAKEINKLTIHNNLQVYKTPRRKRQRSKKTVVTGSRSPKDTYRTIRNNMASLKYAYYRQLKITPQMGDQIKLKWAIDELGNVIHCKVVSSKINNPEFEKVIIRKISAWTFDTTDIPGDVTEVTYPFVFRN